MPAPAAVADGEVAARAMAAKGAKREKVMSVPVPGRVTGRAESEGEARVRGTGEEGGVLLAAQREEFGVGVDLDVVEADGQASRPRRARGGSSRGEVERHRHAGAERRGGHQLGGRAVDAVVVPHRLRARCRPAGSVWRERRGRGSGAAAGRRWSAHARPHRARSWRLPGPAGDGGSTSWRGGHRGSARGPCPGAGPTSPHHRTARSRTHPRRG